MGDVHFLQWLVLSLIQGFTEYLPISSSAHLILVSKVMSWQDQGLIIDLAAHGGSLLAVIWYFRDELIKLFKGENWSLFQQLALASIPLAVFGFLFSDFIVNQLRKPEVIAVASIVFGALLYLSDVIQKRRTQHRQSIKMPQALMVGLAQVLALIPGASRSGVTMSAAMAMGYSRTKAARFSFLLAIPALLMTSAYLLLKVYQQPQEYNLMGVSIVFSVSFIISLLSIKVFLSLIERIPISVFVWYRMLLAALVLWYMQ